MIGRSLGLALFVASAPALSQQPTVTPQTTGAKTTFIGVSAVTDKVAWASGGGGTVIRTIDGGDTWEVMIVPGAEKLGFRDIHAFDDKRAVVLSIGNGDQSRIYHTTDAGKNWKLVFTNPDSAAFYDCVDFRGNTGVVISDAVNGRFPLIRSTDGGATWTPWKPANYESVVAVKGEGAFASSGTCLTMKDKDNAWIGTAVGGRVIHFGTKKSEAFETPMVKDTTAAGITSIAFESDRIGVAGGGVLAKSKEFLDNVIMTADGGRTWTLGGRPTFAGPIYGLAYVPDRKGVVVAVGPGGASWSPDNGKSWQALDTNGYWGIGFTKGGVGWVAGGGGRISKVTLPK